MSRSNNMMLKVKVRKDGSISGFRLLNYSGGGWFDLRLHLAADNRFYWILDGDGLFRTIFLEADVVNGGLTDGDLDELALDTLSRYRADKLDERDAVIRERIREVTGVEVPTTIPRA